VNGSANATKTVKGSYHSCSPETARCPLEIAPYLLVLLDEVIAWLAVTVEESRCDVR
jgi:hypothetical protein